MSGFTAVGRRHLRRLGVALVATLAAISLPGFANEASGGDSLIRVEVGTHQLVRESQAVVRVAVGDPAIADVNVINRRELLVSGKSVGVTSLLVWPQGARDPKSFRIRVGPVRDPVAERQPDSDLARANIDPGRGMSGPLPNLLAHRRAADRALAGGEPGSVRDSSVVDLETQVLTEIKIAEVSRSTAQRYGMNFLRSTPGGIGGIGSPGGQVTGSTVVGAGATPGSDLSGGSVIQPLQNAFNLVVGRTNGVLGVLSVLERKGMARTLAEPSLVATTGQTASFLAGGEFPVPVSQGGATAGGLTVEFKEFGVRLNLTPTVLARDRISLKVAPEVSELDFNAGIQLSGTSIPALIVRRTDTTIELGSGESFVISGLVSTNMINSVDKVPWLGDLPILGAFFRASSTQREERELIMVVTPHLVRPMRAEARHPPLPGHREDAYRPRFDQLMFQETGRFEQSDFGFSR